MFSLLPQIGCCFKAAGMVTSVADSHTHSLKNVQKCPGHSEIIAIITKKHSTAAYLFKAAQFYSILILLNDRKVIKCH